MQSPIKEKVSMFYLLSIILMMLVLPIASIFMDAMWSKQNQDAIYLVGKWFVFWAVGMRLLTAGLRQVMNPAFTAKDIFQIESRETLVIVKELGFANICFGLTGVISLFMPQWRPAAAFAGGLYMSIAGINHIIKKPSVPNEIVAMISDLFIMIVISVYLYSCM